MSSLLFPGGNLLLTKPSPLEARRIHEYFSGSRCFRYNSGVAVVARYATYSRMHEGVKRRLLFIILSSLLLLLLLLFSFRARARARIAGNLDLASRSERFLCAHGAEELVDRVSWLMYVALLGQLRNGRQTNNLVYEMNGLATSPVTEPVNDEFYDEFRRVSGSGL